VTVYVLGGIRVELSAQAVDETVKVDVVDLVSGATGFIPAGEVVSLPGVAACVIEMQLADPVASVGPAAATVLAQTQCTCGSTALATTIGVV